MAKIYVEGWAPEYGSAFETDEALADADRVDDSVEVAGAWAPLPGVDDGIDRVAFVDGVRRVDARLTLETFRHYVGRLALNPSAEAQPAENEGSARGEAVVEGVAGADRPAPGNSDSSDA